MQKRKYHRRAITLLAVLASLALPASASADPLSAMQADASALDAMARTWPQVQSAAQAYGRLAPYADATWAGPGPVVTNAMGFREQCHNTRWDQVTQYLVQLVQSGNAQEEALANRLMAQKGPLLASLNDLSALLNTTSAQLSDAIGPGTRLQPLPITNWQAGIGDAPDLAQAQYVPGPADGAPIGWFDGIAPDSQLARLMDICPTGTGSLPSLPLKAPIMQAVAQALSDEPSLGQVVQPLENGSTWAAPRPYGFGGGFINPARERLVAALATDETGIAGYMAPITAPLEQCQLPRPEGRSL
jgi:hypothetical protein